MLPAWQWYESCGFEFASFTEEGGKERMEQELTYLILGAVPTLISAILISRFSSFTKPGHQEDSTDSAEEIN